MHPIILMIYLLKLRDLFNILLDLIRKHWTVLSLCMFTILAHYEVSFVVLVQLVTVVDPNLCACFSALLAVNKLIQSMI